MTSQSNTPQGARRKAPTDPDGVASRAEFAAALTALRKAAGLTVRDVVARSGGLHGTISGWLSGQHLPNTASLPMFDAMLDACGVTDDDGRTRWHDAVARARGSGSRRTGPRPALPYRGLESFQEADAEWFFGRAELTRSIVERLVAPDHPLTPMIVIGPSGSGKSSVLRAGVVPALRNGVCGAAAAVTVTTPQLAVTALADLRTASASTTSPVLIVDQFEELWTLGLTDAHRAAVIAALTEGPSGDRPPVRVVLALRADFYGSAAAEPALVPALGSPVVVGPMNDEQLREIIAEPARKAGATVDEALVRMLIDEARPPGSAPGAARPGMLPLLSHALLTTWSRSRHKTLTVADYYASGGIGGAVEMSAESVYASLSPARRITAQRVFLRLVTVGPDTLGDDAGTALRRRASLTELTGLSGEGAGSAETGEVIDAFVDRRLLTVGDDTIELSHEVLLTAWRRLHDWIDENRAGLVVRRQLTEAAALWQSSDHDPGTLLSGNRLAIMREWSDTVGSEQFIGPVERRYLDASSAEENARAEQEQRRFRVLRRLVVALAVVSIVAVTAAVVAGVSQYDADQARGAAVTARNEAMARQIATESQKLRPADPALAAQMALASYRVAPVLEARSALLDATAVHSSTRIVGTAGGMKAVPSPDGTWFATATSDGDVRIYRTADAGTDPTPLSVLDAFDADAPPYALAVSPAGDLAAVGGEGGTQLWDVSAPAAPRLLAGFDPPADGSIQDLAFTPDGRYLLAGTSGSALLRWDIADPARPGPLPAITLPGTGREVLAVSPDGRLLAAGGTQSTLRVWDAARIAEPDMGVPLFEIPPDPQSTDARLSLVFTPDGSTLLAGTTARRVERWSVADPRNPRPLSPLTGFTSYVNSVTVSADGTQVAAGSSDNTIRIWSTADDTLIDTLAGRAVVTSTRFMSGGTRLLSAGVDGVSRLWPLPGPVLGGAADTIFTDPIDATGTLLLVGAGAHGTGQHLWDISDPDTARRLADLIPDGEDRFTGATALGTTPEGRRLAAAGAATGAVYLWDVTAPETPAKLSRTDHVVDGIVAVVAFGPRAGLLAVSDQSAKTVHLLDVADPAHPRPVARFDAANYPQSISFAPDGGTIAVATADNTVELWNITTPARPVLRTVLTGFTTYAQAVTFSPDGTLLAAGGADQTVREWDVSDIDAPREIGALPDAGGAVYSLDYNGDGTRLVAATSSGTVRMWNVDGIAMPTTAAKLTAYGDRTFDAQFGRDGLLAAGGPDGAVRLWSTDPDSAAAEICATRGTPLTEEEWARYLPGVPRHALCE
ncbi:nSTAND1 domain-containing NTPase [Tomitella fengzijianii]|uniref:Helix-turn-helix domain-containing protein n=1 Tax=Tomitella fengzijianii TaxID=2597660 RepID=A0A516X009_9ACTN|nr:helix-turn-helix domain-containing protein [Tomitella fengzijianii]QDQ96398.1 helix-turn-helix domain-containing protein [Tomitella fengzijianii]